MEFKVLKQYVKELMHAMERNGIKRVSIKQEGVEIEVEREDKTPSSHFNIPFSSTGMVMGQPPLMAANLPSPLHQPVEGASSAAATNVEPEGRWITSPMVGSFYKAAGPGQPPFIKVGEKVSSGQVVCIVEAMKVMNEIKADCDGTIVEAPVSDGDPVEFGTRLFRVQ